MKTTSTAALAATLLLCAAGCQHKVSDAGSLDVQPRSITLPYPQLATVRLTWTPAAASGEGDTPSEPLVFLHLLGAKDQVLRTFDHPFPQRWLAGAPVSYDVKLYQSALAPPLAPGKYRLGVGLYDRSGRRWAQEYRAAEVEVPPQPAGPRFAFSQGWLPLEAGSDKQVVARRWLSQQPGEIRVEAIPGPGTLWLSFRIPPGDGASQKLVYHDPATNTPAGAVGDTCGAVETGISGPGPHEVEMPIEAPGAEGACRISLVPNFHVVFPDRPAPRSVSLESVAWIAGGARGPSPGDGTAPAGAATGPGGAATSPAAPPEPAPGKPAGGTG